MNRTLGTALLTLLAATLGAQDAALPAVKDILAKNLAASGGQACRDVKSARVSLTLAAPDMGLKGKIETLAKMPDKALQTMEMDGVGKTRQGCDGKVCWSEDPFLGARLMQGKEAAAFKLSSRLDLLTRWEDLFAQLDVTGTAKVGDRNCFVIKATPKDKDLTPFQFHIDQADFLLRQMTMTAEGPQGTMTVTMTFSDYQDVQGIKTPMKLTQTVGPMSLATTVTAVKYNEDIPDAVFAPPANLKPAAPPPAVPQP